MNKTKVAILTTVIGIILIIFISVIIEINKETKEKEYNFAIKTIEAATRNCIKDKKCKEGKITLKELKEKKYFKNIKNPNTKKDFNLKSYINYPEMSFFEVK